MKTKTRNLTAKNAKSAENSAGPLRHDLRVTETTYETDELGPLLTVTREQCEHWLGAMNAKRREAHAQAVREEVRRTIQGIKRPGPTRKLVAAMALVFALLWPLLSVQASEIIRGFSPQDGQLLYAADLDNLIDESTIGVQFFNDQQTTPVLGSGYYFLVLNPATQTYYRINAQQVLYGNTNIFLNVGPEPVPACATLLFYDPTNNWIGSTSVSNFLWNSASNINVAGLSFANTNNAGAAYAYVLPAWSGPWSGAQTNNQPVLLTWGTNGVPYQMALSNAEAFIAADLGTNFGVPYAYAQEFYPWRFYGTNTVSPYTNAFGFTTNFPIVAFSQTNFSGTNLQTLTDTDTIPVNAWQEGPVGVAPTNTSATLLSIYQYMTNKNALPPYTMARAQFSGILPYGVSAATGGSGYGWGVTNMSASSGIVTNCPFAVNWTNPQPASFLWTQATPYSPSVYSNQLYWVQETNMPVLSFQIFTNYANAIGRTNMLLGANGYISGYATLLWVTNFTTVNCSVIPLCDQGSVEPGWYGVTFASPSQTPYYYLTGSGEAASGTYNAMVLSYLNYGTYSLMSTNGFWMFGATGGSLEQSPLLQMMVFPQ